MPPNSTYDTTPNALAGIERSLREYYEDEDPDILVEQEEEAGRNKFVSLRVKWAALLGGAIAVLFFACMTLIYYVESNVIRGQVIDSGASLARFVSSQAAVPVFTLVLNAFA